MPTPRAFAHYTVGDRIGAGGMGEVYRATDTRLGRDVALKMLPEALARDTERLARFRREAQVLAALNHPGIAQVYGLESQDDQHALAMELASGPDLSERLAAGPLPVQEALAVALQLADAVEAAHEKGIVHRDLKPANIKITDDGQVKVLDFGLAKALADDPTGTHPDSADSPTLTAHMTMGNVILGTAAYMSPEQARGTEVDKRSDIWAFGVVLAESLGGRRLFAGETVSDTLASVLKSEIDLGELPDDVPPGVIRLLRRCLRRDPRQRLRDIGDARILLQEVLAGDPEDENVHQVIRANPWQLRLVAGIAVVAVALAGFAFLRPQEEIDLPLRKFEIPMDRNDASAGEDFSPQISPDGRYLLYLSDGKINVRDLATTSSRELAGTDGAREPFWSHDSGWICFGTSSAMVKIDRSGGHSLILANVAGNLTMATAGSGVWNPDGSIFYTTGNTGVLRVSDQAGEVKLHHGPAAGEVDFHEISALPGGRGWIFVVHTKKAYDTLGLLTPDGERRIIWSHSEDELQNPVWSASGHLLFVRSRVAQGIWALPFSLDALEVTGDPFLVAAEGKHPSVSRDGTLVYTGGLRNRSKQLVVFDRRGELLEIVAEVQTSRPYPQLSPDGKQVLLAANAEGGREIWLLDLTNGNERRLTFDGLRWGLPSWHPEGRRFAAYTEPDYEGYLFSLDGSEPRRALGAGIMYAFVGNGSEMVYAKPMFDRGFDFDVYARPLESAPEDGRALVSTPAVDWNPSVSPSGRYLLYISDESGEQEAYVTTYPDLAGRWQVSRDGAGWARWRSDGREIVFTTHNEIFAVDVQDDDGLILGRPRKLFDRVSTDWSSAWADGFDMTADGQKFVMLRNTPGDDDEQPRIVVVQNWAAEFE